MSSGAIPKEVSKLGAETPIYGNQGYSAYKSFFLVFFSVEGKGLAALKIGNKPRLFIPQGPAYPCTLFFLALLRTSSSSLLTLSLSLSTSYYPFCLYLLFDSQVFSKCIVGDKNNRGSTIDGNITSS